MSQIMPNSTFIFEEHQAFYSQLGFYLSNNSSNLNNNNDNNNNNTFSPMVDNINDQSNQKNMNNDNNIQSSFALNQSLFSSSNDVIIPPLFSLQRSTSNFWACEEEKESHGRKRSNGDDILGISTTVKMKKKIKTRKKVREPRFCFKTMSDVDVLDDGYKWRKYGQKVVKNTLHPRSYYRCTQDKCRVKKRVERLAEDPRMVITTYEGRHVHSPSQDVDDSQAAQPLLNNFFW